MQILFNSDTKKYIRTMRFFPEVILVWGETRAFAGELRAIGGKYDKYRQGFIFPTNKQADIENISITADSEDKKKEEIGLTDFCSIITVTDPTPEQTLKRVAKSLKGQNVSVISMPNDAFLSLENEIRRAKDIQISKLPEQNLDGSYEYSKSFVNIIPPDPITQEEILKKEKWEYAIKRIKELTNIIKTIDLGTISQEEKMNLLFELKYYELNIK